MFSFISFADRLTEHVWMKRFIIFTAQNIKDDGDCNICWMLKTFIYLNTYSEITYRKISLIHYLIYTQTDNIKNV